MLRGLLLVALLLVGCRSVPLPAIIAAPTPTPARPRLNPADTIAVGLAREPTTLAAPPLEGEAARWVGQLIFSQLVGLDDKAQPRADLAETVPTLENGGARWVGEGDARQLQATFKLRAGAKWSDGQPVTARDVVFTWQLALNPAFGNALATERRYERVEAADDTTAVFTFFSERSGRAAATREPARYGFLREQGGPVVDPLYMHGLPGWWVYPAHALGPLVDGAPRTSPKAADALAKGDFARKPVGSGPFRVEDGLRFAARPEYFGGAPKAKTIVLRTADAGALARGEVDALVGDAAAGVGGEPGLRVERTADVGWERLDLNLGSEALSDVVVRQALAGAIDRTTLAGHVGGVPIDVPPLGTITPSRRPADPVAAGRQLDGAGWALGADGVRQRGGKRLQLRLITTDSPLRTRLAGTIAQQLAQIGVEVRVEARPQAEVFDRPGGRLARRDFDLALYASVGGPDPPADLAAWYGSASIPSTRNGFTGDNVTGYQSSDLERLLPDAFTALEPPRRADLLGQATALLARDAPSLPLFAHPRTVAVDARIEGLRAVPGTVGETWNASVWRLQ